MSGKILRHNGEKVIENRRQLYDEMFRSFESSKSRDKMINSGRMG